MRYNRCMQKQDDAFMAMAIREAIASKQQGDVPFAAVIVQNSKVITAVANSEHLEHDVTKHAELKAISDASYILGRRDLSDCTIYSTVEPCPMCATAIFYACLRRVVFGMSRDDLPHLFRTRNIRFQQLANDCHNKPEVVSGVLKDKAIQAFLEYKQPFRVTPELLGAG